MITILIPTHNRPNYLKRLLSYYSDYGIAHNIIVADSSSDENKELNRGAISSFSNIDISYIDNYPSEINVAHKIIDALENVNTKYCVLCADDDFITPNGINQSVDFLEHNPDFTAAHGLYIKFRVERDKAETRFCWRPLYLPPGIKIYRSSADTLSHASTESSITFPDGEERLRYHLSNYFIRTFYAVHRNDFLKLIFQEALRCTSDYHFGELLPSMITLIYGKVKCLDVLYDARNADSIRLMYVPSTEDWAKADTYNEQYATFRDCLAIHLTKNSQLDKEASKKVVDDAMSAYMDKKLLIIRQGYKKHGYKKTLLKRIVIILDYLPDWVNNRIRSSYRRLFIPNHVSGFSAEFSPSSKYYDDFNKIRLHVLSDQKQIIRENNA